MIKYHMGYEVGTGMPVLQEIEVVNSNDTFYYDKFGGCIHKTSCFNTKEACIESCMRMVDNEIEALEEKLHIVSLRYEQMAEMLQEIECPL